jgi:hypothetical protein
MTVAAGQLLPELVIEVTPTFVISTAIATRDFQDVHHDRDAAVARGSKDIFLNILTTTGLVQRYVTDWAGPLAIVRRVAIKLGVPCYAGGRLTFSGQVIECAAGEPADPHASAGDGAQDAGPAGDRARDAGPAGQHAWDQAGHYTVQVVGRCSLGDHVTGTVRLTGTVRVGATGGAA